MRLEQMTEYFVDADLLSKGGFVLEIGARSMALADAVLVRGMTHVAVEPDPGVSLPERPGFHLVREAVVGDPAQKEVELVLDANAYCNRVGTTGFVVPFGREMGRVKVKATTVGELMARFGVVKLDLLAMDCEGAEEQIVLSLRTQVARQVSMEFHVHCGQATEAVERMERHLACLGYRKAYAWTDKAMRYGLFVAG